ncbi:peptide ABC transporter permease [Lacrimispora amygdalina]|uniref:ABC transporter permease n=1 Tax=Lacrimispora amygdalina TaxID=253257 RepID=A0A3E2NF92_9FIRM|nr:ABC transporter permease [Clostridium indicum]RFZ79699.1 ABC transporter permease [Clostridium indicum]
MAKYIVRRVLEMLVTLFLIVTATFFLLSAIPGNALTSKIAKLPQTVQTKIIEKYGYDKPVIERYVITMKGLIINGDFGESIIRPGETFNKNLKAKLPVTVRLSVQQILLGVTLGILLGIIAAMKRGSFWDKLILVGAMILVSMPSLVISLLLQKYCANGELMKLPIIGWPKGKELWFGGWKYTILPTIAGSCSFIAYYSRLTKTSMLESINQEYTLTARAKGLSEMQIVKNHVVRNSFIPIITVLPTTVAGILTGSLFIERVFSIPGMGRYYIEAIQGRDIPIVLAGTTFYAIITVITMLITDILYVIVDPRIKIGAGK